MISREDVACRIALFVSGENSLEELRNWLMPVVVTPETSAHPADWPLVTRIVMLLEDESLTEDQHRAVGRLVSRALESRLSNEHVILLLPVLAKADRLRRVSQAMEAGKMSQTAFLSFVAESRLPPSVKQWLSRARSDQVRHLSTALETGAIEVVASLFHADE